MTVLTVLAEHNAWANRRIFDAVSRLAPQRLREDAHAYDPVFGILLHLVQVEHVFFEMAHERPPSRFNAAELGPLRDACVRLDAAYIAYARELDPTEGERKRFLVPWFGFEVTLVEGIVQPLTHSHKHRADVSMLLPRLGGEGVEMDFIQWLADRRRAP